MKPELSGRTIKIATVDDHPMTRLALKTVIEQHPQWQVTDEFSTPDAFQASLRKSEPDVVIIDLLFNEGSGLDLVEYLKAFHPSIRCLVYSARTEKHYAERCLRAGAHGYACKDEPIDVIPEAIERVLKNDVYLSPQLTRRITETFVRRQQQNPAASDEQAIESLSNRELEVLQLIGQGYNTKQIAESVCRSVKTIETYRYRIKKKLGITSGTELAQYALVHREGINADAAR